MAAHPTPGCSGDNVCRASDAQPARPPFDNIPAMCGRMTLSRRELAELADELDAMPMAGAADVYRPRYNVAPTDIHPIVRLDGPQRRLQPAVWGFAPSAPGRPPLFNARAETAPIKDSFRDAFVNGRCVVPADGFYEWAGTGQARRPFWFHRADGKLLLFAGLYEPSATAGAPLHRADHRTQHRGRPAARPHARHPGARPGRPLAAPGRPRPAPARPRRRSGGHPGLRPGQLRPERRPRLPRTARPRSRRPRPSGS